MNLQLISPIGDGGFADVWVAQDDLDRKLAVKIIRPASMGISSALDHAKALARAAHPNVVSVLALDKVRDPATGENVDCVVMELLAGTTLAMRLAGPKFSISEARNIGAAIAEGVAHIHSLGMEHGDLHERNVMITGDSVKVIDILYRDSLALLSTGSRESRLRRDRTSLRLLLQQIIMHSELDSLEATEFNSLLDGSEPAAVIGESYLKVVDAAGLHNTDRLLERAYSRILDEGFAGGKDYAAALADETPDSIIIPLLEKMIDERVYRDEHRPYLRALWGRVPPAGRTLVLTRLGLALDAELPSGRWWPLLRLLCALGKEGWNGLTTLLRLRLENLVTKDVLAGYVDIHQPLSVQSGGSLGTYASHLWPRFSKPEALAENLISLLRQNWYTQNYVGKFFLSVLPKLSEAAGKTEEMIAALKSAVRNNARLVVNSLEDLPLEWRERIRKEE